MYLKIMDERRASSAAATFAISALFSKLHISRWMSKGTKSTVKNSEISVECNGPIIGGGWAILMSIK